jgi:hypothetical protein
MDILQIAETVIRDVLIFIAVLTALLVALLIAAARLPSGNPLRRVLGALCLRLAAMIGAGLVAIPIEPIPVLDLAYDIAAPLGLLVFWITFFRKAAAILGSRRVSSAATISASDGVVARRPRSASERTE